MESLRSILANETWGDLLTAASAIGAVFAIIGLFLPVLRFSFQANKPHLTLAISKLDSPAAKHGLGGDALRSHFFHIIVKNRRTFASTATNVRVLLQSILLEAEGLKIDVLSFPFQVAWTPSEAPNEGISLPPGHKRKADAFFVTSQNILLRPRSGERLPNELIESSFLKEQTIRLEFIAVHDGGASNQLELELHWNGQWSPRKSEIAEALNLRVKRFGFFWERIRLRKRK